MSKQKKDNFFKNKKKFENFTELFKFLESFKINTLDHKNLTFDSRPQAAVYMSKNDLNICRYNKWYCFYISIWYINNIGQSHKSYMYFYIGDVCEFTSWTSTPVNGLKTRYWGDLDINYFNKVIVPLLDANRNQEECLDLEATNLIQKNKLNQDIHMIFSNY